MLFMGLGFISLALGLLGLVLPILPTTPFVLLAAFCFARSSERFYQKLTDNRLFGPFIVNWQLHRAMPRKAKILGLASIVVVGAISIYTLPLDTFGKTLVVILLLIPILILMRIPNVETVLVQAKTKQL